MRRHRLLPIPLVLLLVLAAAAPVSAAEVEVTATNYAFNPTPLAIGVGDTVTWRFATGGHTTTSTRGQADRWDSGNKAFGETFQRTFNRPGRFQYFCVPHEGFMRGTVQVGTDQVRDTVDAFRTRRSGSTVRISFKLNEPATVIYQLRGPDRRTVRRGRLPAGRHSFRVKRLDEGSYRGTLTLEDDFDKKVRPKNSFVVR
jgi:plastocyanin